MRNVSIITFFHLASCMGKYYVTVKNFVFTQFHTHGENYFFFPPQNVFFFSTDFFLFCVFHRRKRKKKIKEFKEMIIANVYFPPDR